MMRWSVSVLLLVGLFAAPHPAHAEPMISVLPQQRMMLDEPTIRVQGAVAGGRVIIEASLTDATDRVWTSRGVYLADFSGTVDVAQLASVGGTYSGVDPFGLFWSMLPVSSSELADNLRTDPFAAEWPAMPFFGASPSATVSFRAWVETRADSLETVEVSATQDVVFSAPGVTSREVRDGNLRGVLFSPAGVSTHQPVLVVSGSGGGAPQGSALALANAGLTAFAVAHFNYPDRPDELLEIPLEYFQEAMEFLKRETGADKVALMGASRGGEGVLLIASTFPEYVSAVVSGVPANIINSACCSDAMTYRYAWTYKGEFLPTFGLIEGTGFDDLLGVQEKYSDGLIWFQRHMLIGMLTDDPDAEYLIRVENITAPILLISGDDDAIWPSTPAADAVVARLRAMDYAYPVEHIKVTGAGHLASSAERLMVTSTIGKAGWRHPLSPEIVIQMGGTPRENFHGSRDAHFRKLEFLKQHTGPR